MKEWIWEYEIQYRDALKIWPICTITYSSLRLVVTNMITFIIYILYYNLLYIFIYYNLLYIFIYYNLLYIILYIYIYIFSHNQC